ncbi:hypothetical protein [Glaciibacter psychrotolerans]|uniref:Uncharacterized protein n=1 Tax=Glaciibacter psychrotolerans TaxID=670054 RepID=A0A7Z0EFN9_9MICO|nr:hypothetical protein [Leifsonia psychrotolerans]NYJ20099.1 hypothetical protein [Leifsonia psychrotolerans]
MTDRAKDNWRMLARSAPISAGRRPPRDRDKRPFPFNSHTAICALKSCGDAKSRHGRKP